MKNLIKWTSENPFQRQVDLCNWCAEQTKLYWAGILDKNIQEMLDGIGFDWNRFKKGKI